MRDPLMTDTVTVYNRFPFKSGPIVKTRYDKTVLEGVMWKESANRNQDSNGKSFLDKTVAITIPVGVNASGGKDYIDPGKYAQLPADDASHWTLAIDSANPDIIVLGDCPAEITDLYGVTQLKKDYTAADIRAVANNTNVDRDMLPHWKVKGV